MANPGWLLDTGAAYTAVDSTHSPLSDGRPAISLSGAQGAAAAFRLSQLALNVSGRAVSETDAVALDLAGISQREGVEISGIHFGGSQRFSHYANNFLLMSARGQFRYYPSVFVVIAL